MNPKQALAPIGKLISLLFFSASCWSCDSLPIPEVRNAHLFHVQGDIVDEQGKPVKALIQVTEGKFESITSESYRQGFPVSARNGKFDLTAGPCDVIILEFFDDEGYKYKRRIYGSISEVPNPLHIVPYKDVSTTQP